ERSDACLMSTPEPQPAGPSSNWPKDEFGKSEAWAQLWFVWAGLGLLLIAILVGLAVNLRSSPNERVTVYCAQDQEFAEPIFHQFEKATGIKPRTVFDNEAVKTVGLANRILA